MSMNRPCNIFPLNLSVETIKEGIIHVFTGLLSLKQEKNRKKTPKAFRISPRIPTDTLLDTSPLLKVQDSEGNGGLGDFGVIL